MTNNLKGTETTGNPSKMKRQSQVRRTGGKIISQNNLKTIYPLKT